jgi:hypothetical protein
MIPHPDTNAQIAHDRQREILAGAQRQSLITQAKATPSTPPETRTVARRLRQALTSVIRHAAPRQT